MSGDEVAQGIFKFFLDLGPLTVKWRVAPFPIAVVDLVKRSRNLIAYFNNRILPIQSLTVDVGRNALSGLLALTGLHYTLHCVWVLECICQ